MLSVSLQNYDFIAGAEVLPYFAQLSLWFQEEKMPWHEVPT